MKKHENQVAVVTGGGQGIGRAITTRLAEGGAAVCILEINADQAEKTCENLSAAGQNVIYRLADVTDYDETEKAIRDAEAELGNINLLVTFTRRIVKNSRPSASSPSSWTGTMPGCSS